MTLRPLLHRVAGRLLAGLSVWVLIASAAATTNLGPSALATVGTTFASSGTYTVPAGTNQVTFDVFGGQGGGGNYSAAGGRGGETTATLNVTPGDVYQIVVGAAGTTSIDVGGGGGGASDVRFGACATGQTCVLTDRVVVGGGGGGGGACSVFTGPNCSAGGGGAGAGGNGNGGAGSSFNCNGGGGGGTQAAGGGGGFSNGGVAPGNAGSLGSGGQGGADPGTGSQRAWSGGDGGGGYYGGGGGGGASSNSSCDAGGGGGGSGFVTASAAAWTLQTGVRGGNGQVVVTPLTGTATTTALGSSSNPKPLPGSVTYTATVSPVPTGGVVQFSDAGANIPGCGAQTVNTTTGVATCTVTYNAISSHPIVAAYLGNAGFLMSHGSLTQTVVAATSTSTGLGSSANPATVRQGVTFTATVSPAPDGGAVNFTSNGTTIPGCGTAAVNTSTGVATCGTSFATAGGYSIVAAYGGDTSYPASSSSTLTQNINAAGSTTTTLGSSANPSTAGDTVTFTATVSPAPDTGTIAFTDGGVSIGACSAQPLNGSGQATCVQTYANAGSHTIGASWAGNSSYPASSATPLVQTVNPRSDTTTVASSKNPTSPGERLTYTATVSPNPGGGTVDFTDGGAAIAGCTGVTLDSGTAKATCTVVYTVSGSHSIVAAYSGNALYPASNSTTLTQTVSATNPSFSTPGTYFWTVPAGVTQAVFTVDGAQGGGGNYSAGGGNGGQSVVTLNVTAGDVYEVTVGGAGGTSIDVGGGGGGASDIRHGSCTATFNCVLTDRVIVAGGGGGGGACSVYTGPNCSAGGGGAGSGANGNGGAASSFNCNGGGGGGTQSAGGGGGASNGGVAPGNAGSLGTGGQGGADPGTGSQRAWSGGDGGNGYYGGGGGGGASSNSSCDAGGGGGGSGFITASAVSSSTGTGVKSGNGLVVIAEYTPTTTTASCTPSTDPMQAATTCTATVAGGTGPSNPATPTGTVTWGSNAGGSFSSTTCVLSAGSCSVTYTPNAGTAGTHTLTAAYGATRCTPPARTPPR
jgi:hypothetical protein